MRDVGLFEPCDLSLAERQLIMVAGRIELETTAGTLSGDPEMQRRFLGVEPLAQH